MNIKAICFDLDGVYFTSNSFKSFKQKIMDMGVSKEDVDEVLHGERMDAFKRGETVEDEFWNDALDYWKLSISMHTIFEMLPESYEVDANVVGAVFNARKNGYLACICSNNFVTRVRLLNEKFDFLNDFDFSVFSYEVGALKPDKKIFEALVERSGCEPEEIIYSDDNESNLEGANSLGINTFVYERFDQFLSQLDKYEVDLN